MPALAPERIESLYRAACLAELDALKVGNVHAYAGGHRMETADFVASAEVSAPFLAAAGARVGERVRGAVAATRARVGQNTNLGILLLCAPLALAAERGVPAAAILDGLDAADGEGVYAAIRIAAPGGLGEADRHDVAGLAQGRRGAMAEAASRDSIARAYTSDYADLRRIGLPALASAREKGLAAPWATAAVHLAFLTGLPDSHIARKHGTERAESVRREALEAVGSLDLAQAPVDLLLAYDRRLKAAGLNPGTSADLTVATLFLDALAHAGASL